MTQIELYKKLQNRILKDYPSANISMVNIEKFDGEYEGIQVSFDRDKLSPVFNLDKILEEVKTENDFERIANAISEEIKNSVIFSSVDLSILNDYEVLRNRLCVDVIPIKGNEYYLSTVPNQPFNRDMAAVVKAVLADSLDKDRFPIVAIDNKITDQLGITKEKICKDAIENSPNINPSKIMYVQDFIYGDDYEEAPWTDSQDNSIIPIRILLTETGIYSSSSLLNSAILQNLANRLDSDFYLIPTNNGALTIPTKYGKAKEVAKMIEEILDKDNLVKGMKSIGELQRYDKESQTLEPNAVYEERINRVKEEVEKQDKDVEKPKMEKEKDIVGR